MEQTEKFECMDCKKVFEMTSGEIKWYEEKNLIIPKRCPECRHARKQARYEKYHK